MSTTATFKELIESLNAIEAQLQTLKKGLLHFATAPSFTGSIGKRLEALCFEPFFCIDLIVK